MATYQEKWKKAKVLFKNTAKVKKPSAEVDSFFRKPAGLDKTLGKLDTADKKGIGNKPEALREFEAAYKEFLVAKTSYMKVLEGAVAKVPDKADKAGYIRGVKVLQTQLIALDTSLKTAIKMARSSNAGRKGMEIMADNLMDLVESSCNAAIAWVARVEANPTPAAFNESIQKYARDITQNIGNINKLTAKGFVFQKAQPDNLFTILKAWGNDGRRVPDRATPAEVLREVNAFEQAVEGVKAWAA
jgi:hypothetical protein